MSWVKYHDPPPNSMDTDILFYSILLLFTGSVVIPVVFRLLHVHTTTRIYNQQWHYRRI
jgi:hypothetical protein